MTSKLYSPQLINRLVNNEPVSRRSRTPTGYSSTRSPFPPKLSTPKSSEMISPVSRRTMVPSSKDSETTKQITFQIIEQEEFDDDQIKNYQKTSRDRQSLAPPQAKTTLNVEKLYLAPPNAKSALNVSADSKFSPNDDFKSKSPLNLDKSAPAAVKARSVQKVSVENKFLANDEFQSSRRRALKLDQHVAQAPLRIFGEIAAHRQSIIIRNRKIVQEAFEDKAKNDFTQKMDGIPAEWLDGVYIKYRKKKKAFDNYAKIDKASFSPRKKDMFYRYNNYCTKQHISPVPVLAKAQGNKLVLNRYRLQDSLWKALSESLPTVKKIRILHLDENGISDYGGSLIVDGLTAHQKIKSFFYTKNEIGSAFSKSFQKIAQTKNKLREINFRGCKTSNFHLVNLLGSVVSMKELKKLGLAEVGLSDSVMKKISDYLAYSNLTDLDISWNSITPQASYLFFKALRKNNYLRNLNYSWNTLWSNECQLTRQIARVLRNSQSMMHLDVSHCQIDSDDAKVLTKAMKRSSWMVCIHLSGNLISSTMLSTIMNLLDVLVQDEFISNSAFSTNLPILSPILSTPSPPRTPQSASNVYNLKIRDQRGQQLVCHADNLVNIYRSGKSPHSQDLVISRFLDPWAGEESQRWRIKQHCYICERWTFYNLSVTKLSLVQKYSVDIIRHPIGVEEGKRYLVGSFNNLKGIELEDGYDDWSLNILLPPGTHYFWIAMDQSLCISKDHQTELIHDRYWINKITIPLRKDEFQLVNLQEFVKIRSFDKENSVFAAYVEDSMDTSREMFENDKKYMKINLYIQDQTYLQHVYDYLVQVYDKIYEMFQYYSAYKNFPSIGWSKFSEICFKWQIVDKNFCTVSALKGIFESMPNNRDENQFEESPETDLCRYEFCEIWLRIALLKFRDKPWEPSDMLLHLFQNNIFPNAKLSRAQQFRYSQVYTVDANDILMANVYTLKKTYYKTKNRPSDKTVWFSKLLQITKQIIPHASDDEIIRAYSFSKQTILDETEQGAQHQRMLFVEYLEFIWRLTEIISENPLPFIEQLKMVLDKVARHYGEYRQEVEMPESDDSDWETK